MAQLKAILTTAARLTYLFLMFGVDGNSFPPFIAFVPQSPAVAVALGGFLATFTFIPVLLLTMTTYFENGGYYVVNELPHSATEQYVAHRPFDIAAKTAWLMFLAVVSLRGVLLGRTTAWSKQNLAIALTAMWFGYASGLAVADVWCWLFRTCNLVDSDKLDQARARLRDFNMTAELDAGIMASLGGTEMRPTASPVTYAIWRSLVERGFLCMKMEKSAGDLVETGESPFKDEDISTKLDKETSAELDSKTSAKSDDQTSAEPDNKTSAEPNEISVEGDKMQAGSDVADRLSEEPRAGDDQ